MSESTAAGMSSIHMISSSASRFSFASADLLFDPLESHAMKKINCKIHKNYQLKIGQQLSAGNRQIHIILTGTLFLI